MKTTIEIDIPDGWEFVRWGMPELGDRVIYFPGLVATPDDSCRFPMVIVRPAWQWPEFIKADWLAKDASGQWYAYESEPTICGLSWYGGALTRISSEAFNFDPPECDWRQSKRRRPT